MRTKTQHLKSIEEAYHDQGKVASTVGLYLREPFAGTRAAANLADQIYDKSRELESLLRELYQLENAVERP